MSTIIRRNAFRYAGVLEAAYMLDDMTVEIIADGVICLRAYCNMCISLKVPNGLL